MKPWLLWRLPLAAAVPGALAGAAGPLHTVEGRVAMSPGQSFLRIVPMPLPLIFKASPGLPAIVGTSAVPAWNAVGQSRRVYFATGDSARETITHYEPGRYFAYRVDAFTLAAKYVAKYAVGEWWWVAENGQTTVRWRYTFVPRSFLARPLLAFFVRWRWRPYMAAAMQRIEADARQHPAAPPVPSAP